MKKIACVVGIGLALCGCVGDKIAPPPPNEIAKPLPTSGKSAFSANEVKSALRVRVAISGADDIGKRISKALTDHLQGALADARFRVVPDGDAEVALTGSVVCNGAVSRGTRTSARGSAVLSVWRTGSQCGKADRSLVAKRQFDARGEAAQNDGEVLSELARALAASSQKWLVDSACRSTENLALCEISVSSARKGGSFDAGYPARFVKEALATSGILDCRVVESGESDVLRASVLYDRTVVKEGVLNRLCAIPSLNLRK